MTSSKRANLRACDDFASLAKFQKLCKQIRLDADSVRAVLLIESEGGEVPRRFLVEALCLEPVGASRLIGSLEEAGLASRVADSTDKRKVRVFLEERGWDVCEKLNDFLPEGPSLRALAESSHPAYLRMRERACRCSLTNKQALCLLVVEEACGREGRRSIVTSRVAAIAGLERTSAFESLKSLEAKGLITRIPHSAPVSYAPLRASSFS